MADHSLFREQTYYALSRQDAAPWADLTLGSYWARPSNQSESDGPALRLSSSYGGDAGTRRYDRLRLPCHGRT